MLTQQILAANPLYKGKIGPIKVEVNATSASSGNATVDLAPGPQGLRVSAVVPNLRIQCRVRVKIGFLPSVNLTTVVTASRAVLTATAVVDVSGGGGLSTALQNVSVRLEGFYVNVRNLNRVFEQPIQSSVRRLVEKSVTGMVQTEVPRTINTALSGGFVTQQQLLGRQTTIQFLASRVEFDGEGVTLTARGAASVRRLSGTPPLPPGGVDLGSLKAPARGTPTLTRAKDVQASLNVDLLNRMGYAAWKGGLFDMELDQQAIQSLGLTPGLQLDGLMLASMFPQLEGMVRPNDPVVLVVSAGAPAVFTTRPAPDLLELALGDLTLSVFMAPAGQPRELVLRVGFQVRADVALRVDRNLLVPQISRLPDLKIDVFEAPLAPVSPIGMETFGQFIVPVLIQHQRQLMPGIPIPVVPGLAPRNVVVERDQAAPTFLNASGDL